MARILMFASLLIASLTGIIYYSCAVTWFFFTFMVVLCSWQRQIDFFVQNLTADTTFYGLFYLQFALFTATSQ